MDRVLNHMAGAVSGYVTGALVVAFIAGLSTFIVLTIIGAPFAAPLAVVAGLFSLVPLVGATIAAVLIGIVTLFAATSRRTRSCGRSGRSSTSRSRTT